MPNTTTNTSNRAYPLPTAGNDLAYDVAKIITALTVIDADVAAAFSQIAAKAGLASPNFTGTPTAPTASPGNDTSQIATTAFVRAAIAALADTAPALLDTFTELAAALGNDPNFATTMATALSNKAPLSHTHLIDHVNGLQVALDAKADTSALASAVPAGAIVQFASASAPTGWLKANGAAISRTAYAALFAALVKQATITISIASPGVVSWVGHGLIANDPVVFNTTGALPTGLVAGTTYYVSATGLTANSFSVSATQGGAVINTSGSQSGTHTAESAPFGRGDGSTTFNLPDLRGEFVRGLDDGRGVDAGRTLGSAQSSQNLAHNHTGTADSAGAHTHNVQGISSGTMSLYGSTGSWSISSVSTSSSGAHTHALTIANSGGTEARPRSVALLYCIKF